MTYAYNVTDQGMVDQINEVYAGFRFNEPIGDVRYLARKIREACGELLPGPASAMRYIRELAEYCLSKSHHLDWVSPTGFPGANRYNKAKKTEVNLLCGPRIRHGVADGHDPSKPRKQKALNSAAPNFVHSMDAAHLIRVVNAAVSEGIINVAVVHDSFSCMAPQARRFNQIIRRELILLYARQDHLGRLRKQNLRGGCFPEFDRYGDLDLSDPRAVRGGEYSFD
jgi:DNA-directed RNA polymerase